jgi:hypothetical protein
MHTPQSTDPTKRYGGEAAAYRAHPVTGWAELINEITRNRKKHQIIKNRIKKKWEIATTPKTPWILDTIDGIGVLITKQQHGDPTPKTEEWNNACRTIIEATRKKIMGERLVNMAKTQPIRARLLRFKNAILGIG